MAVSMKATTNIPKTIKLAEVVTFRITNYNPDFAYRMIVTNAGQSNTSGIVIDKGNGNGKWYSAGTVGQVAAVIIYCTEPGKTESMSFHQAAVLSTTLPVPILELPDEIIAGVEHRIRIKASSYDWKASYAATTGNGTVSYNWQHFTWTPTNPGIVDFKMIASKATYPDLTETVQVVVSPAPYVLETPELLLVTPTEEALERSIVTVKINNYDPDLYYNVVPQVGNLDEMIEGDIFWMLPDVAEDTTVTLDVEVKVNQDDPEGITVSKNVLCLNRFLPSPKLVIQGDEDPEVNKLVTVKITNFDDSLGYELTVIPRGDIQTLENDTVTVQHSVAGPINIGVTVFSGTETEVGATGYEIPEPVHEPSDTTLVTRGFNFAYYNAVGKNLGFKRTTTTGNNKGSLGMENSANPDMPETYPELLILDRHTKLKRAIKCYPFGAAAVFQKAEYGMSTEEQDACIIVEDKPNKVIHVEVDAEGYGIVKCTHELHDPLAIWNKENPPEHYILGIINGGGFPIIASEDLGFIHRETASISNPHGLIFSDVVDVNSKNRVVIRDGALIENSEVLEILVGFTEDKGVAPLKLNAYKQNAPALKLAGGLLVERSKRQQTDEEAGATLTMEATDGSVVECKLVKDASTGKYMLVG